jgi:hypothetical protein
MNSCSRCQRKVSDHKKYNPTKKLCIYCYELLYTLVPCVDCFQQVEKKYDEKSEIMVLCDVCRSQRRYKQTYCARTWFQCSQCAQAHSQWCPQKHAADFNTTKKLTDARKQHRGSFRSTFASSVKNGVAQSDGHYQWNKFLFCSRKCVQKTFGNATWCALCGKHEEGKRCLLCCIPLCSSCSLEWFTQDLCNQCFADRHPSWTIKSLQHITQLDIQDPLLLRMYPSVRQRVMAIAKKSL